MAYIEARGRLVKYACYPHPCHIFRLTENPDSIGSLLDCENMPSRASWTREGEDDLILNEYIHQYCKHAVRNY